MFRAAQTAEFVFGLELRGDAAFRRQTRAALALLQPLAQFELIRSHLAVIRQGRRSGVTAWAGRPVFTVASPTWSHSPEWLAGAIAHDAFHAKLFRDAQRGAGGKRPETGAWSGRSAERSCLRFQREVLLGLAAETRLVLHVESHLANPTYQGRTDGLGAWLDYRRRRW